MYLMLMFLNNLILSLDLPAGDLLLWQSYPPLTIFQDLWLLIHCSYDLFPISICYKMFIYF